MSDQLSDIFHPSLSYLFQKVGEGIRNDQHHLDLALPAFESILTMISSFEAKLIQRNEEEIIKCVMENLAYPTDKVRRYLNGDRNIDMHAANIYIQYIEKDVDKLKKIASEIDQEYEKRI